MDNKLLSKLAGGEETGRVEISKIIKGDNPMEKKFSELSVGDFFKVDAEKVLMKKTGDHTFLWNPFSKKPMSDTWLDGEQVVLAINTSDAIGVAVPFDNSNDKSVAVWKCDSCDTVFSTIDDMVVLYECGNCGTVFTRDDSSDGCSNRCPDCNKFSSKKTDLGCPDCGQGECEEMRGYSCDKCEEVFEEETDLADHMEEAHGGTND
jgi:rubredoxin